MKIALLSGKGGTGKTLTAVNLAYVAGKCAFLDCDAEELNGRLYLNPAGLESMLQLGAVCAACINKADRFQIGIVGGEHYDNCGIQQRKEYLRTLRTLRELQSL